MTIINRRQALTRLGATSAAMTVGGGAALHAAQAPEATPTPAENPELQRLHEQLAAQLAERAAARAEIARIAAEWRDRWPLAPEELLGLVIGARERVYDDGMWRAERDITGAVMFRDPSALSKKTVRRYRDNALVGPVAFYIEKTDHIESDLLYWESTSPKGRTPAALARNTKWIAGITSDRRDQLELARQYDDETARLLNVSGMNAAKARLAEAAQSIRSTREMVSRAEAWTHGGFVLKAQVLRNEFAEQIELLNPELFAGHALARMHRLVLQLADA